jgi:hypothetical protein
LPCSQSTHTQSKPALAMNRDRFVPGNICHAPNEIPEPDVRAFCSRFADFITEAMVSAPRGCGIDGDRYVNCQGRTVYAHRSENKCSRTRLFIQTKLNVQPFEIRDDIGELEKWSCGGSTEIITGPAPVESPPRSPTTISIERLSIICLVMNSALFRRGLSLSTFVE